MPTPNRKSKTALNDWRSFDIFVQKLAAHPLVIGILLTGSTARQTDHAQSDYDLVCIVKQLPPDVQSLYTFVAGRFTEVFFYTSKEVRKLTTKKSCDANTKEGWLVSWAQSGKILKDTNELLHKLQKQSRLIRTEVTNTFINRSWFSINYGLQQNIRYGAAKAELYHDALEFTLLNAITDVLIGYFNIRKLVWRGEKQAISWLKAHDPSFLHLLKKCIHERNEGKKLRLYTQAAKRALHPMDSPWTKQIVILSPDAISSAAEKFRKSFLN